MSVSYIRAAKYFLTGSVILMLGSIAMMVYPGLPLSIEFTGGTLMEFELPAGKTKDDLHAALASFQAEGAPKLSQVSVTKTKTESYFVRAPLLTNEQHLALVAHLKKTLGEKVEEDQFTTIGPTVGASLERRAVYALIIASVLIILYIAIAFRKIPRRLSPMRFGIVAVVALLHDLLITTGVFIVISRFTTFQVDTLFVTALLSIMGYSVMDTIVIFDRLRHNLTQSEGRGETFSQLADRSLNQTMTRTIHTGVCALIMLFALFFLGSESIRWFVLTLIIGTVIGAYSSVFVATPLLVYWKKKA